MKDLRLITIDRDGRPTGFGGVGSAVMAKVTVIKPKPGMRPKETGNGVDRYLAALPDDQRRALERLRRTIRAAAPRAEECISYRLPTFRLDGKTLVAFGATAQHCAFYLLSTATARTHKAVLRDYDTGKGTVRFQPSRPISAALVRKLVKARITENAAARERGARRG